MKSVYFVKFQCCSQELLHPRLIDDNGFCEPNSIFTKQLKWQTFSLFRPSLNRNFAAAWVKAHPFDSLYLCIFPLLFSSKFSDEWILTYNQAHAYMQVYNDDFQNNNDVAFVFDFQIPFMLCNSQRHDLNLWSLRGFHLSILPLKKRQRGPKWPISAFNGRAQLRFVTITTLHRNGVFAHLSERQ